MKRLILRMDEYNCIEVINNIDQFRNLDQVWGRLAETCSSYGPFLSFEWFKLWLQHFLDGHQLLILLLYKRDNLETIAPFLIKQQKFKGTRVRKVELIGNVYSPIQTFLFKDIDKDKRENQISLILQYFSRINKHWDVIGFDSIPEEDDTFHVLSRAIRKSHLKCKEYFCFGNWYSDGIDYSSDIYFKNRSRNLRASIKRNYTNAEKAGKLEFRMITSATNIEKYIKIYFEVYAKSWKTRERVGPDFHMALTRHAAEKGWLRLGLVFLDGVPIAAGFAIVCNAFAYFEKTAYDERYKEIGPGSIWLTEMIKYVIDVDKVSVIDVLRGDDEYKKRWLERRRERRGMLVFNNNLKANCLAFLIQRILPMVHGNKYLREFKTFIARKFFKTYPS